MTVQLTPVETVIMQCLWDSGQDLMLWDLREQLEEKYGKVYVPNALSTMLSTMMKKGLVSRYKIHHSHQYHPEVGRDTYIRGQLAQMRDQWFGGSSEEMISVVRTLGSAKSSGGS